MSESNAKCDRFMLQANAADDGDMTPGLLAMAQSWIEDVAVPSFRGSGATTPTLDGWFDSSQVKLYLMVRALRTRPKIPRRHLCSSSTK